jgi:integrase
LLRRTDVRARTVFLALTLTGLRRSELVGLRWRHLDMLAGTLRVEESKSEEGERLVALPHSLAVELADHYAASKHRADADYVFCHPERGSKLDDKWWREQFTAALQATGITERVRPFHDLRHTALTNLAATGASPIAVMATAGHRSMSTTKQYLHLAGVVFRQDADALERRLLGVESSTHLSASEPTSAALNPLKQAVSEPADQAREM